MNHIKIKIMIVIILFCSMPVIANTIEKKTYSIAEAVKEAIIKNPQISEALARTKSSGETIKKARAEMFAKASMSYTYTGLEEKPVMKQGAGDVQVAHTNQYKWDVTISQPLFTGFALTTQLKLSKLGLQASVIESEMYTLDLVRDVKTSCYQFLLAKKMFEVSNDEVETLTSHRDEATQFYEQGLIPKNDLLKSEVSLSSSIQERERARATVSSSMALINMLLATDLNRNIGVVDIDDVSDYNKFQYEDLVAEAINKRPEIALLRSSKKKIEFNEILAKSKYYPNITAVGRYERNGDSLSLSDNDYENESNSSLSIQAEWTFFEWGKTRADVSKSSYDKRAAKEAIRNIENSISLEVKNALLNLNVAERNIKTAHESLAQAKENWRITKAQYAEQVATSTDVLDARTFLSRADTNYYKARYGYMIYLAELDRAAGRRL